MKLGKNGPHQKKKFSHLTLNFSKIYYYSVCECLYVCAGHLIPWAGVTGGCEPQAVDAGN